MALLALTAPAALAGDAAELALLGFSADGRYFAFEQSGVRDGSGFPYAEIQVIDLLRDAWAGGTPVRVEASNEETPAETVRTEAARQASKAMRALGIDRPAVTLAANPVTEMAADRRELEFQLFYDSTDWNRLPAQAGPRSGYRLTLSEHRMKSAASCPQGLEDGARGFALTILNLATGASREVHRDDKLPASRGCALGYDLGTVARPDADSSQRTVALIGVYTAGFEGADRRYIAVPVPLP